MRKGSEGWDTGRLMVSIDAVVGDLAVVGDPVCAVTPLYVAASRFMNILAKMMYIAIYTTKIIGAGASVEEVLIHLSKARVPGETTQHYYELCHAEK